MRWPCRSVRFEDCTFTTNRATLRGGAIWYRDSDGLVFERCLFDQNDSVLGGGAVYEAAPVEIQMVSRATYVSCRFTSNRAGGNGGGFHAFAGDSSLTNCLFVGNTTLGDGGALWIGGSTTSPVSVTNCTLSQNIAGFGQDSGRGGGIFVGEVASLTLINSIVWGNQAPQALTVDQQITADGIASVTFSCVQDDIAGDSAVPFGGATNGNIDLNPDFADADLRLCAGSPCVDAGDDSAVSPGNTTDLDRRPRIVDDDLLGPRDVDMGAYESPSPDGCNN